VTPLSVADRRAFWRAKRVLVTGHTGFKGSWLALWLQDLDATVFGYALSPHTKPSLFGAADVAAGMTSVEADIRNVERLSAALADAAPEIVFHMAAQSLVQPSYVQPLETYAVNVMGTANLLEAVRQTASVKAVVVVTSDKCYDNQDSIWGYRETDPMGGHDPYSSSKGCAELITLAYSRSFLRAAGVAVASARAGNVIGGGDWAQNRLIPDVVRASAESGVVSIRSPDAIRPWQHVLEPLHGYLTLAERLHEDGTRYEGAWNFGPEDSDARTVRWVVEQFSRWWDGNVRWEIDPGPYAHEAMSLRLDCSKARALLDWAPKLRLSEALRWTAEWYDAHRRGQDVQAVSTAQIHRYQAIASGATATTDESEIAAPPAGPSADEVAERT
jgi:CDP-glucose 4,6-dehydratase